MKSKDSLAPSCVLVVFPVRPKCPDGVAPQAHVNGRKRVCCASIRHDSMLRGEFRAMQAASFGTRPRHDRLRVSGASSEHSAMQKVRPLFTAKHAHTHSRKSRLRRAVVAPLLGRDSPVGPHPRSASSRRNRRKAGSACAGEMGACYTARAIRYGNTQAALCFVVKGRGLQPRSPPASRVGVW